MINAYRTMLCRLLGILTLWLAGCGGGDGDAQITDGGMSGTPATLAIVVSGLPAGTPANITVTGPGGYRQTVAQTITLGNLAAGTYTVTAAPVLTGSTSYQPSQAVQTAMVAPNTAPTIGVSYGAPSDMRLSLAHVAEGFAAPIFLTAPANDPRLFVVERAGRVRIVRDGNVLATPFVDLSTLTTTDGERGLFSMAFDPAYATSGRFYVYYTDQNGAITVARYTVSGSNPDAANPTGTVLLSIPHPGASNHNGGQLAGAEVGIEIAALEFRHCRAAIDVAADDGAAAGVVAVFEDGRGQAGGVAGGGADAGRALQAVPSVIQAAAGRWHGVHLLALALADIGDIEQAV